MPRYICHDIRHDMCHDTARYMTRYMSRYIPRYMPRYVTIRHDICHDICHDTARYMPRYMPRYSKKNCRTKTTAKTLQVKTTTREVTSWENTAGKMQRRRPQGPNQQDMAPQRIDDMDTAIRAKLCLHQEIPWSRQSPRQTTLSQRIRAFPHVKRNVALPTTYKNHEFRHHALQHEQLAEGPPHHT